ncbi:MAG: TolC family protein [Chlamydiae bacterium]|nr:TolC family protein [Chlamydiota bacterium]MBI3265721.1 TolC family protein [Chlamydiota bacterium]
MFSKSLLIGLISFFAITSLFSESPLVYRMEDLVQRALENSQELKLLDEDIQRSEKELKVTRTSYWPHLTLQGNLGVDLFSLEDFDPNRNMGSDLILDWNFFQNGLVFYRVEQAKAQVELARLQKKAKEIELAHHIRILICDLLEKQESLKLQEAEQDFTQKGFEKLRLEFDQGNVRRNDLLKHRIEMYEKQNLLDQARREYEANFQKIKNEADVISVENIAPPEIETETLPYEKCVQMVLKCRVEIRQAEIQSQLTERALRVSKLGLLPRLDLFAGNAFALDDVGQNSDPFQFRTGVIARYPLYDGGEARLQIVLAQMAVRKAHFQLEEAKKKVLGELESAYGDWEDAKRFFQTGELQYEGVMQEFEKTQGEFKQGQLSPYEWEESELSLRRAQAHALGLRLAVIRREAALAKVMGLKSLEEMADPQ